MGKHRANSPWFLLAATALLAALGAPAWADDPPEAQLRVVPTADVPLVEATVSNGPTLPLERYGLVDDRQVRVPAVSFTPWKQMTEPVVIALVIAGQEVMMGNVTIEAADSPARFPGYLESLRAGLTAMDLSSTMPAGSQGLLITYAEGPRVRIPIGAIARLSGEAIGTEKDYYMRFGTDLVGGIELAMTELGHASAPRKVLIVVGDGHDTDDELAAKRLPELKGRAAREQIETYAIVYKGALSADGEVISKMIPRTVAVASASAIPAALADIRERIANRYVLAFPGDHLRGTGEPTYVRVDLGGTLLDPILLPTFGRGDTPGPASRPFRAWWFQLALGLGLLGALALVMRWRTARAARHDEEGANVP